MIRKQKTEIKGENILFVLSTFGGKVGPPFPTFLEFTHTHTNMSASALPSCEAVAVCIRVRPLNRRELELCSKRCLEIDKSTNSVVLAGNKTFTFDYVAGEESSQDEIFVRVGKDVADNCMKGYNGTIFAYGQTGSGKTFTIQGSSFIPSSTNRIDQLSLPQACLSPSRGLTPRILHYLFNEIEKDKTRNGAGVKYTVKCSFLEIYKEKVNDLLNPHSSLPLSKRLDKFDLLHVHV